MGDTRDFLKQQTAAAHRSLDDTRLISSLVAGTLAPRGYRALLEAYQAFYSSWEPRLREKHPQIVADLGPARFEKSRWLAEDLAKMDQPSPPLTFSVPEIPDDLPGLAGCLYVIEGSTLGGLHLSRGKTTFPHGAGRYFAGYGAETVPAWKSFIDWLELHVTTDADRQRAALTASAIFQWFEHHFTRAADSLREN